MMKRVVGILAVWLLSLPLLAAEEQDSDEVDPDNGPVETTVAEDSETPPLDDGLTPPPGDDPDSEDFVPSIRITEDLPVAFPVDI